MPEAALGIIGSGRLGTAIARTAADEGYDVRLLPTAPDADWQAAATADVIIDCSAPPVFERVADLCSRTNLPLVECVSDLSSGQLERLGELARKSAVVRAVNLSLGHYLQTRALRCVTDVVLIMERAGLSGVIPGATVSERHPAGKKHRPSATATALAGHWLRQTGRSAGDVSSLRAGPAVSDHAVRLDWPEQTLTITHQVHSLAAAAAGAIGVAGWVAGRPPGMYTVSEIFDDVLATMARETGTEKDADN